MRTRTNTILYRYPCSVGNRFECPYEYEKGKVSNTKFDVEDLFNLAKMAFAVEIALAKSKKGRCNDPDKE